MRFRLVEDIAPYERGAVYVDGREEHSAFVKKLWLFLEKTPHVSLFVETRRTRPAVDISVCSTDGEAVYGEVYNIPASELETGINPIQKEQIEKSCKEAERDYKRRTRVKTERNSHHQERAITNG